MKIFFASAFTLPRNFLGAAIVLALAGCTTTPPPRGIDYPAPAVVATRPAPPPAVVAPPQDWRASGSGLDANYEQSALLTATFYSNPNILLKQVDRSGAMGINY